MSWNSSRALRLSFLVLVPLALIILGLILLKQILLPFLVGLAAAYMLDPSADRLERLRFSRTSATALITVGFFLALSIIVLLLLPPLAAQATALAKELPGYLEKLRDSLLPLLKSLIEWPLFANVIERFDFGNDASAEGLIREQAGNAISVFVRSATGLLQSGVALLNFVALIFVTPIVTFYMLRDWDRMAAKVRSLVPPEHVTTFERLVDEIDEVLAGFLRGQGLVCLFLAIFYAVGLWSIGLNYGVIIGILTGLFSFIPFIGMAIGMAVGLTVAAFQFQGVCPPGEICQPHDLWMVLVVAGIFGLGQFIEGNLISPRLVGSRIHLHPVWMIFSVLAGTTLFGILGTLLAVPFAAVLGVMIRFGLEQYKNSAFFHPPEDSHREPAAGAADMATGDQGDSAADGRKTGTIG